MEDKTLSCGRLDLELRNEKILAVCQGGLFPDSSG